MTKEEIISNQCWLAISDNAPDTTACTRWVASDESGGTCVFIGTVRNQSGGKTVVRLEFEAYAPMALKEIEKICNTLREKWPVHRIVIHHAVGILVPGAVPVVIVVSAAHRDAAFEACRYAIDTLKSTVPIWKKEVFSDGSTWVAAHP